MKPLAQITIIAISLMAFQCKRNNTIEPSASIIQGQWSLVAINNGFIGKVTRQPEIGYEEIFNFSSNEYQRSKNGKLEQKGTFIIRTEKHTWGEQTFIDYDDNTYQEFSFDKSELILNIRTPKGAVIADAPNKHYQKK